MTDITEIVVEYPFDAATAAMLRGLLGQSPPLPTPTPTPTPTPEPTPTPTPQPTPTPTPTPEPTPTPTPTPEPTPEPTPTPTPQPPPAGTRTVNLHNAPAWSAGTFATGQRVTNASRAYECTVAGDSTTGPTGAEAAINNGGGAVFRYLSSADFPSLDAFAAANPTLTQPTVVQFWNDRPGTAWPKQQGTIVSSATADLTISAAPGESFVDKGSGIRLGAPNAANGVLVSGTVAYEYGLGVITEYITVTRLQFDQTAGTRNDTCDALRLGNQGVLVKRAHVAQNISFGRWHDANALCLFTAPLPSITIANNLLLGGPWGGGGGRGTGGSHGIAFVNPVAKTDGSGVTIANNTIVRPSNYEFSDGAVWDNYANNTGMTIRNNAIFGFYWASFHAAPDGHNALDIVLPATNWGGAVRDPGGGATIGNVTLALTAAGFTEPSNATGRLDVRLAPGSPLLGLGSADGAPATDIFGQPRPAGAVDAGAVQFSKVQ